MKLAELLKEIKIHEAKLNRACGGWEIGYTVQKGVILLPGYPVSNFHFPCRIAACMDILKSASSHGEELLCGRDVLLSMPRP